MTLHLCPSRECADHNHRPPAWTPFNAGTHNDHVHLAAYPMFNSAAALEAPEIDYTARAEAVRPKQREWFSIEDKIRGSSATIRIFDEIGFFGTSAASFVSQLDELDVKTIELHINSPGGEVWDGIAILNALRSHKARVVTIVDGVAASIASVIAVGADEVVMSRNSELMIHDAWGLVVGNAEDMADMVSRLNTQSDNIASVYAEKAGGTTEDWRAAMKAETWYSAAEAVEVGLADRVIEKPGAEEAKARFNLAIFNYAGRSAAPAPKSPAASASGHTEQEAPMPDAATVDTPAAPTPTGETTQVIHTPPEVAAVPAAPAPTTADPPAAPAAGTVQNQEGAGMSLDPAKLREALGLTEVASDEEVRAAVVASGYASFTPFDEGGPKPSKVGRPPASGDQPKGVVMVDESILDQLRQDAAAGQEAFNRLIRQERDATIALAINEGKFAPARREYWEKLWDRDPEGTKAAIKDLSKGLIPTNPKGYSVDPEGKTAEMELYNDLYPEAVAQGFEGVR